MKHPFTALIMAICIAFPTFADELSVKDDAPARYVVKEGDTLWDISKLYLSSPWQWQTLWKQNPQLGDPDLIYPGDVLMFQRDAQGNPMISLDKKGVKKLSPSARVVVQKSTAIPTLPAAIIKPLLEFELALSEEDLVGHPFILGANYNVKLATQGHLLYIKGDLDPFAHYGIYSVEDKYVDPNSQETLAYEANLVGTARVLDAGNSAQSKPATVKVETVKREIKPNDILMPISQGQSFSVQFSMIRPAHPIDGEIISSDNKLREFGATTVVVLNLGREHNVQEGHILDISKRSPTVIEGSKGPRYVEDASRLEKLSSSVRELFNTSSSKNNAVWNMPEEKIGELMIFKVYDKVSYALVTSALQPIRIGDSVGVN
ncbi:LysM peptidoglycan-binding domain-containing protein [Pseudoalteromonas byunsanensis]|uniref:Peptidoglycan-binding protein n=1 Tax=Pseudoalteromonas byunsanensis TaxID=327939 RepID=A0A1S1NC46_9GAMM|nr:LysM domain-containing protein [Pseudoalteromonas byunsanensis]OHU96978.1 peptidoglycan-binding protein [Pseudoalteromonas byunsanensis]